MTYNGIEITDTAPRPPDAVIAEVERLLGAPLPEDYLNFLDKCNGGVVECGLRTDSGSAYEFGTFYQFHLANKSAANPHQLVLETDRGGLPPLVLPIAIDVTQHVRLYLDLRTKPSVQLFNDGSQPAWADEGIGPRLERIGDSFSELWDLLTPFD